MTIFVKLVIMTVFTLVIALGVLLMRGETKLEKASNPSVMIDLEIECRVCKTTNYVHMHNAKEE